MEAMSLNYGDKVYLNSNPEVELTVFKCDGGFALVEWYTTEGVYQSQSFDVRTLSKY
jgi:hypothetical protein